MRSTIFRLGLVVAAIAPVVLAASFSDDYGVATTVVSGGGGTTSSSAYTASFTVGQLAVGRSTSSVFENRLGFWEAASERISDAVGDDFVTLRDQLQNCAPNPFNPATTIRFSLKETADVRIDLYDLRGRRLERLLDEPRGPGYHTLNFRPTRLASGVYILEMKAGSFRDTRRMVLLK